jgi:hypothetical protein
MPSIHAALDRETDTSGWDWRETGPHRERRIRSLTVEAVDINPCALVCVMARLSSGSIAWYPPKKELFAEVSCCMIFNRPPLVACILILLVSSVGISFCDNKGEVVPEEEAEVQGM